MGDPEDIIRDIMKNTGSTIQIENLMMESFREVLKDEIKNRMQESLERNPEIKKEISEAIDILMEARLKEALALMKLAKASTKLGVESTPPDVRKEMIKSFTALFEKELGELLENTL